MKKLCIIAIIFTLMLNAIGCTINTTKNYPWKIIKSSVDINNKNENIVIQFIDDTLTSSGAQLTLYNGSATEIEFGSKYLIQICKNDSWYDINIGSSDWTAELCILEPNHEYSTAIDWTSIYGELPAGTYRFVKEYTQAQQNYFVFVEFEIP